jgi:hypothetical protein
MLGGGRCRKTEIQTAESFGSELSASEFEVVIKKFKSYMSPGFDHIPE